MYSYIYIYICIHIYIHPLYPSRCPSPTFPAPAHAHTLLLPRVVTPRFLQPPPSLLHPPPDCVLLAVTPCCFDPNPPLPTISQLAALDLEAPAPADLATTSPSSHSTGSADEGSTAGGAGAGAAPAEDGPAIHPSAEAARSPSSLAGEGAAFVPTRQWLYEWKAQLKLGTLLRLIQVGGCAWGRGVGDVGGCLSGSIGGVLGCVWVGCMGYMGAWGRGCRGACAACGHLVR
jgi:hypothetical protein